MLGWCPCVPSAEIRSVQKDQQLPAIETGTHFDPPLGIEVIIIWYGHDRKTKELPLTLNVW